MFKLLSSADSVDRFIDQWNDSSEWVEAHTSGSTGTPKKIKLLKSDMQRSARSTNARFGITDSSVLASALSADYIAGKMMIVRAMEASCRLIMAKPALALPDFAGETIDLLAVVPAQCSNLMENGSFNGRVRNLIVGGAPVSPELEKEVSLMPWRTFATYGMTETCSHVALREFGSDTYRAMPGISFEVDERSCLVINAPDFSFGRIVTNDVVSLRDSNSFQWLGRFDNVINSGGVKFYPEQLERLLHGHIPYPFFLTSAPHPRWGECVVMAVEAPVHNSESAAETQEHLLEICREYLPRYAVPKRVVFLPSLPRTSNGKVKRTIPDYV